MRGFFPFGYAQGQNDEGETTATEKTTTKIKTKTKAGPPPAAKDDNSKYKDNSKSNGNGGGFGQLTAYIPTHDDEAVMYGAPELWGRDGGEQATSKSKCRVANGGAGDVAAD